MPIIVENAPVASAGGGVIQPQREAPETIRQTAKEDCSDSLQMITLHKYRILVAHATCHVFKMVGKLQWWSGSRAHDIDCSDDDDVLHELGLERRRDVGAVILRVVSLLAAQGRP